MKHITVYDKYNDVLTSGRIEENTYMVRDNRIGFQYDNGQEVVVFMHFVSMIVIEDVKEADADTTL
jgi:hypothetical protein